MGADDQLVVPWMDRYVMHGGGGQIITQRMPGRASVERGIYSEICSNVEDVLVPRVLSDYVD